jgi:hypothetical protein
VDNKRFKDSATGIYPQLGSLRRRILRQFFEIWRVNFPKAFFSELPSEAKGLKHLISAVPLRSGSCCDFAFSCSLEVL